MRQIVALCFLFAAGTLAGLPLETTGRASALASPPKHLFIFGLGYTGLAISELFSSTFGPQLKISGTCREVEKQANLNRLGIDTHIFDLDDMDIGSSSSSRLQAALADSTHVISTIGASADNNHDAVLHHYKSQLVASNKLQWTAYLSTTGVYGDHQGAWVDESSPLLAPPHSQAHVRIGHEREWLQLREQSSLRIRSHVFRLAGIYGVGRSALATLQKQSQQQQQQQQQMQQQQQLGYDGNFVSRVHVLDIARSLLASTYLPEELQERAVYNVGDDEPASRSTVMAFAQSLLQPPSFPTATLTNQQKPLQQQPTAREIRRASEHKRVDNRKLKQLLLDVHDALMEQPHQHTHHTLTHTQGLVFPTYKQGLLALSEGNTLPFR